EPLPTPSPTHPTKVHVEPQADQFPRPSPTIPNPDPSLEGFGRDQGAKEIKALKAQLQKFRRKTKPLISHHQDWVRSVKWKQILAKKESLKRKRMQKEFESKQGMNSAKADPYMHKDQVFNNLDDFDGVDYMESDTHKEEGVSTNKQKVSTGRHKVSTDNQKVSTDRHKVSTDNQKVSTDRHEVSTDQQDVSTDQIDEGTAEPRDEQSATPTPPTVTPTSTTTIFGDDETIAQVLITMSQNKEKLKEKEKGVELRDVEESERPRPTSTRSVLTLKPFPKIDPKDKGKKRIEEDESDESDIESKDITTAEKKFKQLAHDEEMARKIQEEWESKVERKILAEEEATNDALIRNYDDVKARIEADRLLAERLQEEEREQFTIEERAKFLHDTIEAQRKFLAQQRAAAIRSKPHIKTQLRNQMMTYLKDVGNKKHSELKNKTFKEIQALYEREKRFDKSFTAVGSIEDERKINDLNEKAQVPGQKTYKRRVAKEIAKSEDTVKVPAKVDVTEQGTKKRKSGHIKMIARKKPRPLKDVDSDEEHRRCLKIVIFDSTIDSEVMETKSSVTEVHKVSSPDGDYLVLYRANGNFRAFNYLMDLLHIFYRQDLFHLYELVIRQYLEVTLEGYELIMWGDLKIMMESSMEENDLSDF
ncbi:hypothetical protein Tco_0835979, partial [Tanacetum coccineum]